MKNFQTCTKNNNTLKYILKKANRWGFYSIDYNNYPLKALSFLNQNNDVKIIQMCHNVEDIVRGGGDFKESLCGYFDNGEYLDDHLFTILLENMCKIKAIILITDFTRYVVDTENNNEFWHHSTCIVLCPSDEKIYNLFYINSHGNALLTYNYYDIKVTQKRAKRVIFDIPLDFWIVKKFVHSLQEYINMYEENITIKYNTTKHFNYVGANLQSGDGHGICFSFPLIIIIKLLQLF